MLTVVRHLVLSAQAALAGRAWAAAAMAALLLTGGAWPTALHGAMMTPGALDAWATGGESACGLAGGGASSLPVRPVPSPGQPQPGERLVLLGDASLPGMGSVPFATSGLSILSIAILPHSLALDLNCAAGSRVFERHHRLFPRDCGCDLLRPPRSAGPVDCG